MTVRNARVSVRSRGEGACFGATGSAANFTGGRLLGFSEVGEMIFENAELKCVQTGLDGVGIGAGRASNLGMARVSKIIMRNTTFDCTVANGVCIGAGWASDNGLSEVGSVRIEGGRISAHTESGPVIGTIKANLSTRSIPGAQSILGEFTAVGTVLEVFSESTLAIGIGPANASAGCESIFRKAVISDSIVRTSGIGGSSVELNRITVECTTASVSGCLREANFTIQDSLNGRTLGTRFFGDDIHLECDPDTKIFIGYGGGANSELEILSGRNLLRLAPINYPYEGRYRFSARVGDFEISGELGASDHGALFSLGNRTGPVQLMFAPIDQEAIRGGHVLQSDGTRITAQEGETVVANPNFKFQTHVFTTQWTPYKIQRRILRMVIFTYLMRM
jgi:hypothetical protein